MSRPSMRPRPRDSIFAGGSELRDSQTGPSPNLYECVYAMQDCIEQVNDAQHLGRNGTYDMPRMTKVLQNEKLFFMADENTIRKYKAELAEEIDPQIVELLVRAEKGTQALRKKQTLLEKKVEAARAQAALHTFPGLSAADKLQDRRLQLITKQRQRLEREVAALEVELGNLTS